MGPPALFTADVMLRVLCRRLRKRGGTWVEILGSEIPPGTHTNDEMLALLREKWQARGDRGIANLFRNVVIEPRNPFEPHRRRFPKREVVAVGALVGILFGAVIWFNFLAR